MFHFILRLSLLAVAFLPGIASYLLYAPIDSGGVRGNVSFEQEANSDEVQIRVFITSLAESFPQQFDWALHEFPVFFDLKNPCQATELGKSVYDFSRQHGQISIPSPEGVVLSFSDKNIHLKGANSIWGRSLYFKSTNTSARACTNIMAQGKIQTAVARFTQNIAGTVMFRANEQRETIILTNLFYTLEEYRSGSRNDWKILVTDILDTNTYFKCNHLQILLDPDNVEDTLCSSTTHSHCKIGDMSRKHGQIVVGNNNNRYSKKFFIDTNFSFDYLESNRKLFVVIYEKNSNNALSCAEITPLKPKQVKAHFDSDGVKGDFTFKQNYRTDPTVITVKLDNLRGRGKFYQIHEFPFTQRQTRGVDQCSAESVGALHNPFNVNNDLPAASNTNDQYGIGDLSGKHGTLSESQDTHNYFNSHIDFNLPLFGPHSVLGRSIVIHKPNGTRWICANIAYSQKTTLAKAIFYFPIIGEIVFRQEEEDPFGDTTVFGELIHSESFNVSRHHVWRVHNNPVGLDFYNWTKRCMSSGDNYNPYTITPGRTYNSQCSPDNHLRCQVGDLHMKYRKIDINAFPLKESTKFFYVDSLLPLTGPNSIIARSVVIEDDNAPQIRGKRLACSTIRRHHSIEAIVDNWRTSSGIVSNISGLMEFSQDSEFDETKGKLLLNGLNRLASGYHIHKASVPMDKEFPCSGDTVYGHYNPFEIDSSIGPFPTVGSVDEYETGDLSGKFGLLNNLDKLKLEFSDSNLPVKGINSVIGRSVVIHKEDNNFRWSCGTIKPKVGKNNREVIAIASFDDPRNLILGYVRFRQIEYFDGSLSDTWVETYLKHRDSNSKKITYGHRWSIYVNQVGADAYNHIDSVRCIAGGYLWNPYFTKIDEPYKINCNPRHYLRCALGDLTGRHGPLAIGGDRQIYSDPSLPLIGNYSILNRALVISLKNHSDTAIACANVKLDKHLVSTIIIQKIPAFTVAKFMHHMRTKLDAAEWLAVTEVQKTTEINNNECIKMLIHFYGDEAWRLQSEFNNLIEFGSVRRSKNGELIKTYYKSCKAAQMNSSPAITISCSLLLILFCLTQIV